MTTREFVEAHERVLALLDEWEQQLRAPQPRLRLHAAVRILALWAGYDAAIRQGEDAYRAWLASVIKGDAFDS